jgi:Protein of unknown function (DUF559)/Transcriptional regulator, AbiEi antitoxin
VTHPEPATRDEWRFTSARRRQIAKRRVAALAAKQAGRVTSRQLRAIGVGEATINRWARAGELHSRTPGVYAVGHYAQTVESDLWEAILYAGPGAALAHGTAAWWRGMIDFPVRPIHVATPRRRRSLPGIAVHGRRNGPQRTWHNGMPVTSIPETLLDLAAVDELTLVRRSLAKLDFAHSLHAQAIRAICGQGRHGSVALRWAIDNYEPLLADTQSPFEDDYVLACETCDIPKPDRISKRVLGIPCDAIYDDPMVIVELDGIDNHHSPAQIRRDHRNDKKLRDNGWLVLRYTTDQLERDAAGIRAEIVRELEARRRLA